MIKVAVVGLGKMGISHLGMIKAHPGVDLAAVCDATGYVLDVLKKYTGVTTFSDYDKMLDTAQLDAVIIATPSRTHYPMVRAALERGIHVFCEKPFTLSGEQSEELAALAQARGLVNQVGYHNRFVGSFMDLQRLEQAGAIGTIHHVVAEAYGPVVLKPKSSTWRTQRSEGGGCLYDYAAHPINLVNWLFGMPETVGGSVLGKIFSADTDDEVYSTLFFPDGKTGSLSVNWSDESFRKMTTRITLQGTAGRIYADRQEIQVFLREGAEPVEGYNPGWNIRYTTDLTKEVYFYIRGEEYSAQLDYFVQRIADPSLPPANDFRSAAVTDQVIDMIIADASRGPSRATPVQAAPRKRFGVFRR